MKNSAKKNITLTSILLILIIGSFYFYYKKEIQKSEINNNDTSIVETKNNNNNTSIKEVNNNTSTEEVNNNDTSIEEIKQEPKRILTHKEKFNTKCSDVTKKEDILKFINNSKEVVNETLIQQIESYVKGETSKSEIDNTLLIEIGNTDNIEAKEKRLLLNSIFLIINNLEAGTPTNCDSIYDQYNK